MPRNIVLQRDTQFYQQKTQMYYIPYGVLPAKTKVAIRDPETITDGDKALEILIPFDLDGGQCFFFKIEDLRLKEMVH